MKKVIFTVMLTLISMTSMAQFTNSKSSAGVTDIKSSYNRIHVSYAPISWSEKFYEISSLPGFALGWTGGWNITKSVPLYLETGANLQMNFDTEKQENNSNWIRKQSVTTMRINVPVNVSYRFTIPNSEFSIAPYSGLHLTGNIIGKGKFKLQDDYNFKDDYNFNFFDKDDMEDLDIDPAKRIQIGYQLGVNFTYKKFSLGIGYTEEFSKYMNVYDDNYNKHKTDLNTSGFVCSIGLEF